MSSEAPALFITGTDTGVGKTWVSAALAAALVRRGQRVGVLKPAETGWPSSPEEAARVTDGAQLKRASEDPDPLERIVPFRFAEGLAPSVAARRAGSRVDVAELGALLTEKRAACDVVLVEGAGGLMVPLTDEVTTLQLIEGLGLPVLVVAANRLGVLNHTLLTVDRLRSAGVETLGVLLNETSPEAPDLARRTNVAELERLLGGLWLGHLPWSAGGAGGGQAWAAFEASADLDALLDHLL